MKETKDEVKDWTEDIPWDKYKWAQFACLTQHRTIKLYRDKPHFIDYNKKLKYWWHRYCERSYETNSKLKGHKEYKKLKEKGKEDSFMIEWESAEKYEFEGDIKSTLINKKGKKVK